MNFLQVVAWVALVVGVAGFVLGLRSSRVNDEMERGVLLWAVLSWGGVLTLVASRVA